MTSAPPTAPVHPLETATGLAVDAILGVLEDLPASVRQGTDPMVLLYWWKRQNSDTALFRRALEDMDRDGLITIGPPPERWLRLSAHGFAWLDTRLPIDDDALPPDPEGATAAAPAPRLGAEVAPLEQRTAALVRIFTTLDLPPGRGLEAGTLQRLWRLDGHPGADLRETLDALVAQDRLLIERGAQTVFVLAGRPHGV